jgi:hypothetical protein
MRTQFRGLQGEKMKKVCAILLTMFFAFAIKADSREAAPLITKGVDDLVYDPGSSRLYAPCDGDVDVYQKTDADNYKLLGKVSTGPLGRTAPLVPQSSWYFVAVPQHGAAAAEILGFGVR